MAQIYNPTTRTKTYYISDDKGFLTEHKVQDVGPILELCSVRKNDGTNGYTPSRDMRHIGFIPALDYQCLMDQSRGWYEGITDDTWVLNPIDHDVLDKLIRKYLNERNKFMTVDKL